MKDRGVSDALGFVLVFGLIVSTITTFYVVGFDSLQEERDSEERRNVERAFDIIQHSTSEIVNNNAPSRSTEVKLSDSSIALDSDVVTLNYTVTNSSGGSVSISSGSKPLVYRTNRGDEVILSHNTLITSSQSGKPLVADRMGYHSSDWGLSVSLVQFVQGKNSGVGGGGTALVRMRALSDESIIFDSDSPYTLRFTINGTEYQRAWSQYCQTESGISFVSQTGDSVTCSYKGTHESILIRFKRIRISFAG